MATKKKTSDTGEVNPDTLAGTPENISGNLQEDNENFKETSENNSENHTETEGTQKENIQEAASDFHSKPGKLVQNSFKVVEADKTYWEEFSKNFRTKGEAFTALLQLINRKPETVTIERSVEVIKEIEVVKEVEKEVIKEIPAPLNTDEYIVTIDFNTVVLARACRPHLKRDAVITTDDKAASLSELVNKAVRYFLTRKYDHVVSAR